MIINCVYIWCIISALQSLLKKKKKGNEGCKILIQNLSGKC